MSAKKVAKKTTAKKAAAKKAPAKKAAKKAPAAKKSAAKKTTAKKPTAKKTSTTAKTPPTTEAIAQRAYLNYLHRVENGLPGDEHTDWIEAVRMLGGE